MRWPRFAWEWLNACEDCGAGAGLPCTDACESAAVVHADRVWADLDSAESEEAA